MEEQWNIMKRVVRLAHTDTSQKYLPTAPLQFDPATNPPFYFSSYTSPTCPISMEINSKRRKTAELSTEQRSAIVFGHKNGISQSKLANEFECSRRTIYNTLKRFEEHQLFESLPRTGRPPILSSRASTCLYLQARRHPFWTYK
jgi:hypothetical protein